MWVHSTRQVECCQISRTDVRQEVLHPQVKDSTAGAQQLLHLRQAGFSHEEKVRCASALLVTHEASPQVGELLAVLRHRRLHRRAQTGRFCGANSNTETS